MRAILVAGVLVLVGCAPTYEKVGATREQRAADLADCEAQAPRTTTPGTVSLTPVGGVLISFYSPGVEQPDPAAVQRCMEARGYALRDPLGEARAACAEAARRDGGGINGYLWCMQQRGY